MNFTALVVEDDILQREALADLLRDRGLEVIECSSAEAAELVVAKTGAELRALVTDVGLSGAMSGVELAQYAKRRFPHINVVMISGKPPPYIPQDTLFFLKPYRTRDLVEALVCA
jgi:DNA-binding NtrC family response regulator